MFYGASFMKKISTIILIILAALVGLYFLWSAQGRTAVAEEPDLYLDDVSSFGVDSGSGNLVAMQTYMQPQDYASAGAYYAKLDGYMAQAQVQDWLHPDTIVVFPEWIGTWLVLANEKEQLYEAETLEEGMQFLVLSDLLAFVQSYTEAQGNNKIRDALFRMKADIIAQIHQETFSDLAQKYGVTIVSGSLILPEPQVVDGELLPGEGELQNIAPVFHPDGTLDPALSRKVFPTGDEGEFVGAVEAGQLPFYTTPAGELAVLICADSWYPESYATLVDEALEIIVVPNNFISDVGWNAVWQGYDPGPGPVDVDQADIGSITEGEARLKYTLAHRMQGSGAITGMHVFFRGNIWDLVSHGHTIIFTDGGFIEASAEARGAVINYWLPA